mgnify:FL=1
MAGDWLFQTGAHIVGLRAAGVLVRDGRIFLQRDADGDAYALPGGHIRIGETLEDGLAREYREETGASIRCRRLLWSEESFWTWKDRQTHTIAFYYLIELEDAAALPDSGVFVPDRDSGSVVLGWTPIEALQALTIYPRFLKEEIHCLDGPIKHFISTD